jgi:hypothetical protein
MKKILTLLFLSFSFSLFSQTKNDTVIFSGYVEAYFSYDFNEPRNHSKDNFLYNHKRHNEFNINLAYAKAHYKSQNTRANLALMVGNYSQYNLENEPISLQHIMEANVGVKLSKEKNIWLDVGVMPSHIGFESAVSQDCWTLTRSILAENSPYFETGAKLSFENKKQTLQYSLLLLNGWQNIQRKDGYNKPSYGVQITYKSTHKLTLNYSNFIGSNLPDSLNSFRTFHNFYAIYEPNKKVGFIGGFDIGTQDGHYWYSPVVIVRYSLSAKKKIALRCEYYNDENNVVINTTKGYEFDVFGVSLNYDYAVNDKCVARIEAKNYSSENRLFANETKQNSFSLIGGISIKF